MQNQFVIAPFKVLSKPWVKEAVDIEKNKSNHGDQHTGLLWIYLLQLSTLNLSLLILSQSNEKALKISEQGAGCNGNSWGSVPSRKGGSERAIRWLQVWTPCGRQAEQSQKVLQHEAAALQLKPQTGMLHHGSYRLRARALWGHGGKTQAPEDTAGNVGLVVLSWVIQTEGQACRLAEGNRSSPEIWFYPSTVFSDNEALL